MKMRRAERSQEGIVRVHHDRHISQAILSPKVSQQNIDLQGISRDYWYGTSSRFRVHFWLSQLFPEFIPQIMVPDGEGIYGTLDKKTFGSIDSYLSDEIRFYPVQFIAGKTMLEYKHEFDVLRWTQYKPSRWFWTRSKQESEQQFLERKSKDLLLLSQNMAMIFLETVVQVQSIYEKTGLLIFDRGGKNSILALEGKVYQVDFGLVCDTESAVISFNDAWKLAPELEISQRTEQKRSTHFSAGEMVEAIHGSFTLTLACLEEVLSALGRLSERDDLNKGLHQALSSCYRFAHKDGRQNALMVQRFFEQYESHARAAHHKLLRS